MPIAFTVPNKQRDRYMPMCADSARDPGDEQELTSDEWADGIICLWNNSQPRPTNEEWKLSRLAQFNPSRDGDPGDEHHEPSLTERFNSHLQNIPYISVDDSFFSRS